MRYAIGVEYNGRDFRGWQSQPGERTVQGELQKGLSSVADHEVTVITAGRTDTGVHGLGQVAHFDTDSQRDDYNWLRGVNTFLPKDIRVKWVLKVSDEFHARFSAVRRSYRYILLNQSIGSAIHHHFVTLEHRQLKLLEMRDAASRLVGEHDFSSFRAAGCQAKSPVRTIHSLEIEQHANWFCFDVIANAFLQHMVRNLVGVLVDIGCGERPVEWVEDVLNAKERTRGGKTAKPNGLYLTSVSYAKEFGIPSEQNNVRYW